MLIITIIQMTITFIYHEYLQKEHTLLFILQYQLVVKYNWNNLGVPRDPNNKHKHAIKYCSSCHGTNHCFSACFKKHRDDEDKLDHNEGPNLLNNRLYNTFVPFLVIITTHTELITKIDVEVSRSTSRHRNTNRN